MVLGGEAVVDSLVDNGVKYVYGLPGTQILDIYNSLRTMKSIKHFLVMHENNAAFMADAHGRLTGEAGVCLTTAGPGATNAVTGIAQAYTEASPVVHIAGHPNKEIQPDHGVDDWDFLLNIYRPITKWNKRIERIDEISTTINEAFRISTRNRKGPVHVELPEYVLRSLGDVPPPETTDASSSHEIGVPDEVIEKLTSAERPLIAVGKGVQREFCSDEVIRFSERLGSPVITLETAIGAIPYQCPLYLGYDIAGLSAHPLIDPFIQEADLILSLGLEVGERITCFSGSTASLIHVHHENTLDNSIPSQKSTSIRTNSIISVLKKISDKINSTKDTERMKKQISDVKKRIRADIEDSISWKKKPLHPGEICVELWRHLDDDAIVTLDEGSSANWMKRCYRAKVSNTILTPGRYRSMGFALPAAIAAKINFPDRQTLAVTGDGGLLMSSMELPTIVKYGLNVVVLVQTNRRYGTIWQAQRSRYRSTYETEVEAPNFAKYAQACGANGVKVETSEDLKNALDEAFNVKEPTLIDVETAYKYPFYNPNKHERYLMKFKNLGIR